MARKILYGFLGLMLAGLAAAAGVLAQPGKFQDQFLAVKRSQMGPALGIDQRTVDQLLQVDQRYQPLRQQLTSDMKTEFRRLQQVMAQPAPSDQEVKAILASMKGKQREMENLKQRQDEEEMALLTPVQQARYILYLQSLMREARTVKSGPPGPPSPPAGGGFAPAVPREVPVVRPTR
jgi:Spy/CpxP family protein refolding chaperone